MSPVNLGELLNLVGLSTGVALYAMLLAMVIRARRRAGDAAAFDPLLASHVGSRSRLEPVRAGGLCAAEVGHRRTISVRLRRSASAPSACCRPSSSTRCCAAATRVSAV